MRQKTRKYNIFLLAVILTLPFIGGCIFQDVYIDTKTHKGSFIYSLQSVGFEDLQERDFEIAVVDIDDSGLSSDEIIELTKEGKIILSYLSIGEAEEYRAYWKEDWKEGNPEFICKENPNWKGNYKVKYWYPEWKKIVFSQLDLIIEKGFDGAYLDLVDSYKYFEDLGFDKAREKMIQFVIEISSYSSAKDKGFLIIPQNAEELIIEEEYFSAIDGIGKENLLYIGKEKLDEKTFQTTIDYLVKASSSGKKVFIISYTDNKESIDRIIDISDTNGFYYFIGRPELDSPECQSSYYR